MIQGLQKKKIVIHADYREEPSGIPSGLMLYEHIDVRLTTLKTGDYQINERIIIERKSAEDFIQSLVSNRLFNQCSKLMRSGYSSLLLLEGNPYKTRHQISRMALKGALLSVVASWRIPVIYSGDRDDSITQLVMISRQSFSETNVVRQVGSKPKRLKNQQLKFLQGLPDIGPVLARRLCMHFENIEAIMKADPEELQKVGGIGKKGAAKIREFLTGKT